MKAFIHECIKANKEIYDYINHHLQPEDFDYEGNRGEGGDRSLNIDLYAESIFVKYLSSFGNIYSEESGFIATTNKNQINYTIVIDPLDGSDNFVSSLPYYGTSVALEFENEMQIGVVCNLINGRIYTRNEQNLLQTYDLDANIINDKILESGKAKIGLFERSYAYPQLCLDLSSQKFKYRSPGAVALSLACAKYYNFVLFAGNIREFDIKASLYICSDLYIYKSSKILLVAKNKDIFTQLKNLLNNNRL